MKIKISKSNPSGTVYAPPSKSFAHRMIICASLCDGKSVIKGVSKSEDILATLDCASSLGAKYTLDKTTLTVWGAKNKDSQSTFCCRESGSTLRFFMPISLVTQKNATFFGTPRLMERGIGVFEQIFLKKGISVEKNENSVKLCGVLTSGEYSVIGNVSSQFISGLLFALPLLDGDSILKVIPPVESRGYIDITLGVIKSFGVNITEEKQNTFVIKGNQKYSPRELAVEGDWSNGAALLALGRSCNVLGLNPNSLQGDRICLELFEKIKSQNQEIDISDCPDLGPVLFAYSAINGGGRFVGTKRLLIKESDRAHAMADEMKKFGINVTVTENSVTVHKGTLKTPTVPCDSHNDHRIVMALSMLGLRVGCEIENAGAITKSYPNFFDDLKQLGAKVETDYDI